jgi:hypothetical protein
MLGITDMDGAGDTDGCIGIPLEGPLLPSVGSSDGAADTDGIKDVLGTADGAFEYAGFDETLGS